MLQLTEAIIRWTHIVAGSLALLTFWLPWVVKKGGAPHRRVGWLYVGAMALVAASGFAACALRLADDQPGNDANALFLAYVGLLAAASMWMGVRVLRQKKRTGPSSDWRDLGMGALLASGGAALIVYAAAMKLALFAVFGVLGLVTGSAQLRYWLRPPAQKLHWLYEHIGGMGTTCISTVTAFLVVNARHFGLGGASLVLWIAPGVLGGVGIAFWQLKYRKPGVRVEPQSVRHAPAAP